jgi:hypothetical protein
MTEEGIKTFSAENAREMQTFRLTINVFYKKEWSVITC